MYFVHADTPLANFVDRRHKNLNTIWRRDLFDRRFKIFWKLQ